MNIQVLQCINYKRDHVVFDAYIYQMQAQDFDAQAEDTETKNLRSAIPAQEAAKRGISVEKPARVQQKTNAEQ